MQKEPIGCMALVLCTCKQLAPLHWCPSSLRAASGNECAFGLYTIAYLINLTMITPWFLSLVRLQHVREVVDLFDVGTSGLKKLFALYI